MRKQVLEEKTIFEFTHEEIKQLYHEIQAIDVDSKYQVQHYELLSKFFDEVTPNFFDN